MITRNQVREARIAVARAAGERWRQRRPERERTGAVDSPDRQRQFAVRETIRGATLLRHREGTLPTALERIIGPTIDLIDYAPSEAARIAGRPVARIVVLRGPGLEAEAVATGFLVTSRLLLTNWHVLPSKDSAIGLGANFRYERIDGAVQIGSFFEIKPSDFYYASEELDFALVAVDAKSLEGKLVEEFGSVRLIEATGKILKGHPVNIIQHPDGRPKSYAVTDNRLVDVLADGFLHYTTDTLPGSSGAPAFSQAWELVALHHSGVPEIRNGEIWSRHGTSWDRERMNDDDVNWVANEGVRVSAIVGHLAKIRLPQASEQALLDELLTTTSDPLETVARLDSAATLRSPPAGIITARTDVMGTNVFNFTGPVTIHIQSGAAAAQIIPQQVLAADAARLAAVEKVIRFDTNYDAKEGYKDDFLEPGNAALRVPMPKVVASRMGEIFMDFSQPGEPFLFKYRHYSLVMNKKRRMQMWSAVNVDYTAERRDGRSRDELGTDKWIPDPRIPTKFQITDPDFYQPAGNIDRGHIVRREDSAWGDSPDELEYSNSDTFHWTNCTPQHEAFNQENPRGYSGRKGIWGEFEAYIKSQITQNEERCCILAGPVLRPSNPSADFGFGSIQYPIEFWKVVVVAGSDNNNRRLQAFGFILSQADVVRDFGIEFAAGRFSRYQKKLSFITQRSGVEFDPALLAADMKQ